MKWKKERKKLKEKKREFYTGRDIERDRKLRIEIKIFLKEDGREREQSYRKKCWIDEKDKEDIRKERLPFGREGERERGREREREREQRKKII
jgi:hypothetical protein